MQYSPKLKKAAEEIKDILSKYDIAGIVLLHTPGFGEQVVKLDPTYSACKPTPEGIRLKSKLKEDYQGDVNAKKKKDSDTSNMLTIMCNMGASIMMPLMEMSEFLDQQIDASHTDGGFTSHETQNN